MGAPTKDYYAILGVSRDADQEEIKRAYRKRSLDCHPDLHPNDADAERRFKEIGEAYKVLSDPEQRRRHDQSAGVTLSEGARAARDDFFRRLWRLGEEEEHEA